MFLADAAKSHLAKGVRKLYVCYKLGTLYVDLNLDFDGAKVPEEEKKRLEREADAVFIFACEHYMFR